MADPGHRAEQLRVPPQSVEAEQAVLGGLMLVPDTLPMLVDWLSDSDFYRRDHQLIYRAIRELAEKDKPFDAVTLGEWFESMGLGEQVAGGAYLIELASTTPSAANIEAYAEIVVDKSRLRQLIEIGNSLVGDGFKPDGRDVPELVQAAQHRLTSLAPAKRTGPLLAKQALQLLYADLMRRYEAKVLPGAPTPWFQVNDLTHGLQDGEVVLVAARSNMGKSVVGFQLSAFNALRGNRTLRFSLEMAAHQAARRDLAALSGVPHTWLLEPIGEDANWDKVTAAIRRLGEAPLLTDDSPRLSASQICARAQREHLHSPLRMVLVDHLHEMLLPGKQGEVIERADALRDLKALAKNLNCPVVVLAQLNRGAASLEHSEARRPRLTDLRGSGGIEEVADVVLFLHRPDYYKPDDMPGVIELSVGKGRDIPTGRTVYLRNRFDVMRADDWEGPLPLRPVDNHAPSRPKTGGFKRTRAGNAGADAAAGNSW
ncbi:MAG TPA: DnaB-like helicase C-terminal domain-containing protein [Lysobacter sp.]